MTYLSLAILNLWSLLNMLTAKTHLSINVKKKMGIQKLGFIIEDEILIIM